MQRKTADGSAEEELFGVVSDGVHKCGDLVDIEDECRGNGHRDKGDKENESDDHGAHLATGAGHGVGATGFFRYVDEQCDQEHEHNVDVEKVADEKRSDYASKSN